MLCFSVHYGRAFEQSVGSDFRALCFEAACCNVDMAAEGEDNQTNGESASGGITAVTLDETYVKHPLNNSWSLWFFKTGKSANWADNLKYIADVGAVEDFWGLYNHVQPVVGLPVGCDYSFFKKGIQPMWEDKQNVQGGRWLLQTNKAVRDKFLDSFWLEILLLLVGEGFGDDSDDVCGAVVQLRGKGDKLAIWTRDCTKKESILRIGRIMRSTLNMPSDFSIGYQSHRETSMRTGSVSKNMYTL